MGSALPSAMKIWKIEPAVGLVGLEAGGLVASIVQSQVMP
jgi:hypothetical protein